MGELGTALRELAREAEPAAPADATELWRRGRVRVRVRRLGAAGVAAAVTLLLGGLAAAGPEPRLISPASSPDAPGIPSRVEDPPGWLPVTPYGHAVGPLAVLARGVRHGQTALFGINANSGSYRFLDLPDQVPDTPVALSPDGRWVAYWSGDHGVVTGLTAFDTVRGTSSGLDGGAETSLGLEPGPVTWLDDRTVLLAFGQRHKKGGSIVVSESSRRTETFQPGGQGPTVHVLDPNSGVWSRSRDGLLLVPLATPDPGGKETVSFIGYDRSLSAVGTEFVLPPGGYGSVSLSGDRVVAVGYTGAEGHVSLLAGTLPVLGGVTTLHDVGDLRVGTLLGWHSDHSVLVTGWRHSPEGQPSLFEVDLTTGTVRRVGDAGDDVDVLVAMAGDLLEKPFVAANPPHGLDPRLVRGAGAGVLVLAALGIFWWRRRDAV
jgi:hypothetical protein